MKQYYTDQELENLELPQGISCLTLLAFHDQEKEESYYGISLRRDEFKEIRVLEEEGDSIFLKIIKK